MIRHQIALSLMGLTILPHILFGGVLELVETEVFPTNPKSSIQRSITFETQLAPDPSPFDAPNLGRSPCVRPLNPMTIHLLEPTAGVNGSTGLVVILTGINASTDCASTGFFGDSTWADEKDVVLAHLLYRNISFFSPYDFGKYQIIDVLRGLRSILEEFPDLDRNRVYLYGGSGGGHLSLQVLQVAPELFAEVVIHCPITKMTVRDDVLNGYTNDPFNGWNTNLGFPTTQGALTEELWSRYRAERALRSPLLTFPLAIASGAWDGGTAPRITMMHGDADQTVSYTHFIEFQAAINAQFSGSTPWTFATIPGGNHSYAGADVSLSSREAATNTLIPDCFTSTRQSFTEVIDYAFPVQHGWTYRIQGTTLSSMVLDVESEQTSVSDWIHD